MKVWVRGAAGQLGHDVINELNRRGHVAIGSDVVERNAEESFTCMDITDALAVEEVLTRVQPEAVIHCAAWTAVDLAEEEDQREKVHRINADGTRNIAKVCKKLDCKMIYISTDYVFDGQGEKPWQPDCKDFRPLNVYGQTKLEGELAVSELLEQYVIVRIAWVFGIKCSNFI